MATVDELARATDIKAHACCQGTDLRIYVDSDAVKPSQILCMDLELAILQL